MSKDAPKNESKIQSKIKVIAEKKGIKSSYGLQKFLDVAPTVAVNLWNNDVTRFSVEILELLCKRFACGVGDLLVYAPGSKPQKLVAVSESVKVESVKGKTKKPAFVPSDNEILFSTAEVAEKLGVNERTVRDYYNGKSGGKLARVKIGTKNFVRESDLRAFMVNRSGYFD
jgi:DNA-binding Xre family transcriptional regulator